MTRGTVPAETVARQQQLAGGASPTQRMQAPLAACLAASIVASLAMLTGCASPPPPPPVPLAAAAPTAAATPVQTFEARQRQRAQQLERQGALADAALAIEAVVLLHPDASDDQQQLTRLRVKATQAAADRVQQGSDAQARGELDVAARHYLAALALQPGDLVAAQALREVEAERNRRAVLGKPARSLLTRRAVAESEMREQRLPDAERNTIGNDHEHAAMLLAQGDADAAIALMAPRVAADRRDVAARRLLAAAHLQRSEQLDGVDRPGAIAALEQSLRLDRKQPQAAARLQAWKAARKAEAGTGAAEPLSPPTASAQRAGATR